MLDSTFEVQYFLSLLATSTLLLKMATGVNVQRCCNTGGIDKTLIFLFPKIVNEDKPMLYMGLPG